MGTRSAALITIGIVASLMVGVALAALFSGDISERAGSIATQVLGSLATVLAGLLLFLRVETVASKADEAATKAATVESKVEQVHHDILNGGLRENVKKAISEDRHAQRNRDTIVINRDELDRLRKLAQERQE